MRSSVCLISGFNFCGLNPGTTVCGFKMSCFDPEEELLFVSVTSGPSTHQRTSPFTGQVKLERILMRRTESEHRQGSVDIHSTIHSNKPRGGDFVASEKNKHLP